MTKKTVGRPKNPAFYALMVALLVMSLGPIIMMVTTSLKLNVDIMSDASSLWFSPTLENYETVLCDVLWYEPVNVDYCNPTFSRALGNSIFIALMSKSNPMTFLQPFLRDRIEYSPSLHPKSAISSKLFFLQN